MRKKKNLSECFLNECILRSILKSLIHALTKVILSHSVPCDSALYGFLVSANVSLKYALNHTSNLRDIEL